MLKRIIGIAGEIASGKDTVTAYLVSHYGAKQYRFSDPLRSILGIMHLPVTRDNMIALSIHIREAFGQDILAHIVEKNAQEVPGDLVIIDGVRRLSDIDLVKNDPNFTMIYTEADAKIRYERLHKRKQNVDDGTITYEEFLEDHQTDTERFIPELKGYASSVIVNEGSLEELQTNVDALMKTLGIEKTS